MPKIALFLGAGASKPFGLPTVNEFFGKVNWERDGEGKGYRKATEKLVNRIRPSRDKYLSPKERLNEALATAMHETSPLSSFNSEWLFEDLQKIVATEDLRGTGWNITECTAQELLTFLKREVIHVFGQEKVEGDPSLAYLPLIRGLNEEKGIEGPLKVFTTNYDTIIETFFRNLDSNILNVQFIDGFKKGSDNGPREWSIKEYQPSPQVGNKLKVELFKLHGSVAWKFDKNKVFDLGLAKPTEDDCLLYPGYKGVPEWEYVSGEPFWSLHGELIKALHTYELFIVIGFSFGDAFIKSLFSVALKANPRPLRVVFITPDESKLPQELNVTFVEVLKRPFEEENLTKELLKMKIVEEINPQRS